MFGLAEIPPPGVVFYDGQIPFPCRFFVKRSFGTGGRVIESTIAKCHDVWVMLTARDTTVHAPTYISMRGMKILWRFLATGIPDHTVRGYGVITARPEPYQAVPPHIEDRIRHACPITYSMLKEGVIPRQLDPFEKATANGIGAPPAYVGEDWIPDNERTIESEYMVVHDLSSLYFETAPLFDIPGGDFHVSLSVNNLHEGIVMLPDNAAGMEVLPKVSSPATLKCLVSKDEGVLHFLRGAGLDELPISNQATVTISRQHGSLLTILYCDPPNDQGTAFEFHSIEMILECFREKLLYG